MKFTEAKLETAFTELLANEGYAHAFGAALKRTPEEVLLVDDLKDFLFAQYQHEGITANEVQSIVMQLQTLSASDFYESNKTFLKWVSDGFALKREDRTKKDIWVYLLDYSTKDKNTYRFVTQMEIIGTEKRIPDGIIYINGLPLVVFEFKSAIREDATLHDAFVQITTRYTRDIPELFKYNAIAVISDGVNNKAGSLFAPYEFFYAWRRVAGLAKDVDGINSMYTLVQGMFHKERLKDILCNFIYIPESSKKNEKIVCRYPQYYAARALFDNIKLAQKPFGGSVN
jgi:type I restriction enzyme R subunit